MIHQWTSDDIERRITSTSGGASVAEIVPITRADGKPRITGLATVFYDGTPKTEYRLEAIKVAERIMPGAFDKLLGTRPDVVALFNHDPNNILGRTSAGTLSLSVDKRGLRFTIEPAIELALARSVLTWIARGEIRGNSFSFIPGEVVWRKESDWDIREIRGFQALFDVGPVTYPAYEATSVSVSGFDAARGADNDRYNIQRLRGQLLREHPDRAPAPRPTLRDLKRQLVERGTRHRREIASFHGDTISVEELRRKLHSAKRK